MALQKSLIITGAVLVIGLAGASVSAMHNGDSRASIISESIAEHFNLDQEEVSSVIEESRKEMLAERFAHMETERTQRLDTAVEEGVLTQEQRERLDEFHTSQQEARQLAREIDDREERMDALKEVREAFAEFREQNSDIPFDELRPDDKPRRGGNGLAPLHR